MYGPKWLFYSFLSVCGPGVVNVNVGTGCVSWVELLVQRRFYQIFMSDVGLPNIHEYSVG